MENYHNFCASFDKAYNGEITITDLEKEATKYDIDFDDFCDANDFVSASTWKEALEEYKEQIKRGERG